MCLSPSVGKTKILLSLHFKQYHTPEQPEIQAKGVYFMPFYLTYWRPLLILSLKLMK